MGAKYSLDSLKEIADGDKEFLHVIVSTFLEEIPPDLKQMKDAIYEDKRDIAYQFAHKMKPNFEMFGLNLAKEITEIETWTQTFKSRNTIDEHLNVVLKTVNTAIKDLKKDFKL